ncbi:MAG TPA: dihydrodipicolinate reductase C-terminal domain-containing protein [Vicinamibacterales bacterium]|jgi:4-hydroxy-tetrahydrodipicolinate reductase|nr:dihydrodipicolinate reductase C-terminal domain-containing protein [Vicinamibacterales bacterium]
MPRLLVVGQGRMGTLVEGLASAHGFELAGVVSGRASDALSGDAFGPVDVAIDFTNAEAVGRNLAVLAERGIHVVIGTTGLQEQESVLRAVASRAGIGVVAAANFSLGMNLFQLIVEEAARRLAPHGDFGAWIHEAHHDRKKDAPSGTALTLKAGMSQAGFGRGIDISSTRAGFIPGTHTVGFDGPSETIELTHTVRDRGVFARGALVAASWVVGRRGWFSMRDVLK